MDETHPEMLKAVDCVELSAQSRGQARGVLQMSGVHTAQPFSKVYFRLLEKKHRLERKL